jgi:hypothetical protein
MMSAAVLRGMVFRALRAALEYAIENMLEVSIKQTKKQTRQAKRDRCLPCHPAWPG